MNPDERIRTRLYVRILHLDTVYRRYRIEFLETQFIRSPDR